MFRDLPKVTKNLLIINTLIWFTAVILHMRGSSLMMDLFALHFPTGSGEGNFHFWQPLTYMFMHDDAHIWHILFNMYTLVIFGAVLERSWGASKFLLFYLVCGVGAGLCQLGAQYVSFSIDLAKYYDTGSVISAYDQMSTVGASGAIYGLLLGFGMLYPDSRLMLIFPPVAMKAKWFVIIFAVVELVSSIGPAIGHGDGVAHIAHLGGMLFGLILILIWKRKHKLYEYHD